MTDTRPTPEDDRPAANEPADPEAPTQADAKPEPGPGADTTADAARADGGEEDPVARLTRELEEARAQAQTYRDQALRALAEQENLRKRTERDKEQTARFAIEKFARDLLESADNLNRAIAAVPADQREGDTALAQLVEGVGATERQMINTFEKHGMVRVDPVGEKFDPNYHQAMFEVPNSGQMPGTVVQVMAPGFVLNGRLLRPAMVGVAKGEAPAKVDTEA